MGASCVRSPGVFPGTRLLGVDASTRAVRLAQALNPEIEYRVLDIVRDGSIEKFEAATLIEVIEHIPPALLPEFVRATADCMCPDGRLVLTVPHRNKPLITKHYQHFTGEQLRELLAPHFHDLRLIPFDLRARRTPLMWLTERVLGAKGRWWLLTNPRLLYLFYRLYLRRFLYCRDERDCERIAVVATKSNAPRLPRPARGAGYLPGGAADSLHRGCARRARRARHAGDADTASRGGRT